MADASWYWHRLRAMSPGEVALHVRKKLRQVADARRRWELSGVELECSGAFPKLPKPEDAPEGLRDALRRDADNILAGRWKAFGHLELQVDDPPRWHKDYLAGKDFATNESAFKLNYRELPGGADIKLIWELSRWYQLVRLAMTAYVLGDARAAAKCVEWLEDWVKRNPPYRGWNWTSALEVGMRLVQFTWMDALLGNLRFTIYDLREDGHSGDAVVNRKSEIVNSTPEFVDRLERLRREILPPHVWYAWRHQSFGSSANNHLIGELAGLILATARWPALARWGVSLDELQARWEREVLAQFAEDGGNKEQALNYHLFSWEFCWQARMALAGVGRKISPAVDERLERAAQFFVDVQVPSDPWDYGDSDSAFVTPLFADAVETVAEWHGWFCGTARGASIHYWLGEAGTHRQSPSAKAGDAWTCFPQSGYALRCENDWRLRWDVSPLGLGRMAAHGHLDALHLSLWLRGVAMVIDPGTGAYYADGQLRTWLASRLAHNGPFSPTCWHPSRLGAFIWDEPHENPWLEQRENRTTAAVWADTQESPVTRSLVMDSAEAIRVEDGSRKEWDAPEQFSVRWQFAPESRVEMLGDRRFRVTRRSISMEVQVSAEWAEVFCVTNPSQVAEADPDAPLAGTVSPAFRKTVWAPYLKLVARPQGDKPCVFTTTFLASAN
jgi:hypothetical protein